jgi:hypothetical protein
MVLTWRSHHRGSAPACPYLVARYATAHPDSPAQPEIRQGESLPRARPHVLWTAEQLGLAKIGGSLPWWSKTPVHNAHQSGNQRKPTTPDDGPGPTNLASEWRYCRSSIPQAVRRPRHPRLPVSLLAPTVSRPGVWLASLPEDFPGDRARQMRKKGGMLLHGTDGSNADVIPRHSPHTPPTGTAPRAKGALHGCQPSPGHSALPGFCMPLWALSRQPLGCATRFVRILLGKAEPTGSRNRIPSRLEIGPSRQDAFSVR